jgi:hypothetical protein
MLGRKEIYSKQQGRKGKQILHRPQGDDDGSDRIRPAVAIASSRPVALTDRGGRGTRRHDGPRRRSTPFPLFSLASHHGRGGCAFRARRHRQQRPVILVPVCRRSTRAPTAAYGKRRPEFDGNTAAGASISIFIACRFIKRVAYDRTSC